MKYLVFASILLLFSSPAYSHTLCGDDSEPTVVEFQEAGASYGPYTAWKQQNLPCGETANDAIRVGDSDASYRWVRYAFQHTQHLSLIHI